ncbi:O-antigen polymerase [Metabacillus schmidteae]|uniref:O-antigen polymerase n=1 Tax=Metabacillus schmidteae TaxID=2730405 RepID=UPI00158A07C6|nr:O-antigen polymerase [Metabacillus schmidteae]
MTHIAIHILIIIIGIQLVLYDTKRNKQKKIRFFTAVNLVFIFVYGIIPLVLYYNKFFVGKTDAYIVYTVDYFNEPYLYASFLILIGYISFVIGYFHSKPYLKSRHTFNISHGNLRYIGIFLLIISCASVFLVASGLGGVFNSLSYIQAIRSGGGEVSISSIGFMLLPIGVPPFLIFLSFVLKEKKIYSLNFLFMLLSLFNSIYYVLIFGGRLPLALFLLILVFYYLDKKNSFKLKILVPIALIGIVMLEQLEQFFEYLSTGEYIQGKGVIDSIPRIAAQFSFPYINTLKVHSFTYTDGEFRYFIDFISWLYNLIPNIIMDLLGGEIITPSYINNSNNYLTTGIPTDIIAFGYYQFAIPGVIIISILFGKVIGWFDRYFNRTNDNIFLTLVKVRLFEILIFYPMYADIEAFMRRRVDAVILIIILILFSRVNKKKSG